MIDEIRVTGIVVSCTPIGEYDKRVVLITAERGKIHAFARGARKQGSRMLAGTEPFLFGSFKLASGRNAYSLVETRTINYFEKLRSDIDRVYYGFYFLELASYFSKENVEAKRLIKLIYAAFRALEAYREALSPELIRAVYEWKVFDIEGIMPAYDSKSICGLVPSDTAKYTLNFIRRSEPENLFTFTLSDEAKAELIRLADRYRASNIDVKFNSLEMI